MQQEQPSEWIEMKGRKYRLQGDFYITEDEIYLIYNDHQYKWDGFYYKRYHYAKKIPSNLHRAVWEHHFGEIPPNHHIHHRDGNPRNNTIENLQCLPKALHLSLAAKKNKWVGSEANRLQLLAAQEKAKLWPRSEEGKKWYKVLGKNSWEKRKPIKKKCLVCAKEYEAWYPHSKFCHNNCKSIARRRSGVDTENRKCQLCQKYFIINRYSIQKFCGKQCVRESRRIKD